MNEIAENEVMFASLKPGKRLHGGLNVKYPAVAIAMFLISIVPASAHEFWIAPEAYRVQVGDQVVSSLRVGKMMRGTDLPYLSDNFRKFVVRTPGGDRAIQGRMGDIPASSYTAQKAGLHTIMYHSEPSEVTYEEWDVFRKYLAYEGLEHIIPLHRSRGLPDHGFKEAYTRIAKSLVQVGEVNAQDRDITWGTPLELIAEENPYTPGRTSVRIKLARYGEPVIGRQIAILRFDGAVSRSVVNTDDEGSITVPIDDGGLFLLNATDLQPVNDGSTVWESYWASLTFGLPVRMTGAHPLDPLSNAEIARAIRVIGESGHADRDTRVSLVTLAEPDKTEVLSWAPGKTTNRRALAVIRNDAEVFEAIIDLASGSLRDWRQVPGVQPAIQSAEWAKAEGLVKRDPRWIEAMRKRGYEEFSNIFCEALSAGYFDLPEERGRRIIKLPCYDINGARTNIYGRPIEGLIAIVDLVKEKVVRVIDTGRVPINRDTHEFQESSVAELQPPMRPVRTHAPAGWNFRIEGRMVSWLSWSFHLGFDARFGPLVSLVQYRDGPSRRMVLYQGHISEIFVPYMDPAEGWYFRSYMDAGEYGLGVLSSPLEPGIDCPEGAIFLDATLTSPTGRPYLKENLVCVFERDPGAPLWRHYEALNGAYEGRPSTELVVRSIPTIGNYDYVVDWVFTQQGEIQVNIGATGIDAVKGVATKNMNDPGAAAASRSGILVAPNLVAVHHDHYFSIRLDMDIDGSINSFVRERLVPTALPQSSPRRSLWQLQRVPMSEEGALSMGDVPELWRFENSNEQTSLGHYPSYQIQSRSRATSLLSPDDWPQRRAAFSGDTLWVTVRQEGELFAGGPYPNQDAGESGLKSYVNGESVNAADIVAWYTIGFHHLTRPEDWPVLPTVWHGVKLRPYGFFAENPSLGVRRRFSDEQNPSE